jgi:hypothetical protein
MTAPSSRARATAAVRYSIESMCPSGLPGLFSQISFVVAGHSVGSSDANAVAPAMAAPTAYVGYATVGCTTTSPSPRPSSTGIRATSSLEPMVGSTLAVPSVTPRRRRYQAAIASRSAGEPAVAG